MVHGISQISAAFYSIEKVLFFYGIKVTGKYTKFSRKQKNEGTDGKISRLKVGKNTKTVYLMQKNVQVADSQIF